MIADLYWKRESAATRTLVTAEVVVEENPRRLIYLFGNGRVIADCVREEMAGSRIDAAKINLPLSSSWKCDASIKGDMHARQQPQKHRRTHHAPFFSLSISLRRRDNQIIENFSHGRLYNGTKIFRAFGSNTHTHTQTPSFSVAILIGLLSSIRFLQSQEKHTLYTRIDQRVVGALV